MMISLFILLKANFNINNIVKTTQNLRWSSCEYTEPPIHVVVNNKDQGRAILVRPFVGPSNVGGYI